MPDRFAHILSRRRLLGGSLAAGGFLLMGGAGFWALSGRAAHIGRLRCLTDHEYRTLSALTGALFPPGGAFALGAQNLELERAFDAFLADEPEWNRADLKRALFLLEYGPVLFERRLKTFSNLGPEERLAHFQRWAESGSLLRRQVALAFRKFLSLIFYDQPGAWPAIGYDGPLPGAQR